MISTLKVVIFSRFIGALISLSILYFFKDAATEITLYAATLSPLVQLLTFPVAYQIDLLPKNKPAGEIYIDNLKYQIISLLLLFFLLGVQNISVLIYIFVASSAALTNSFLAQNEIKTKYICQALICILPQPIAILSIKIFPSDNLDPSIFSYSVLFSGTVYLVLILVKRIYKKDKYGFPITSAIDWFLTLCLAILVWSKTLYNLEPNQSLYLFILFQLANAINYLIIWLRPYIIKRLVNQVSLISKTSIFYFFQLLLLISALGLLSFDLWEIAFLFYIYALSIGKIGTYGLLSDLKPSRVLLYNICGYITLGFYLFFFGVATTSLESVRILTITATGASISANLGNLVFKSKK